MSNYLNYNLRDYQWHGSSEGACFEGYDPQNPRAGIPIDFEHEIEKSDFGPGFYLGDDKEAACAWAARYGRDPSINQFDIDAVGLSSQCTGSYIDFDELDETSVHSLLVWSLSCIHDRREWLSDQEEAGRLRAQLLYEECLSYLGNCDWIVAKRSDDRLWKFVPLFFADQMTVEAFWLTAMNCSLGNQLVLRSEAARPYITCCYASNYQTNSYRGIYDQEENRAKSLADSYIDQYSKSIASGVFPDMTFKDFASWMENSYPNGIPVAGTTLIPGQ